MKNIFIINGGQKFGHSGGLFNETIANETIAFFENNPEFEVKHTNVNDEFMPKTEVEKFVWADVIIYHTPIWWFQLPHGFKKYIDVVFTEGQGTGIYENDGRSSKNPKINYGTGGMLHGRKYLVTTSWNAPQEAFTMENEFFNQKSVDDGVLFGFHRMNAFTGMKPLNTLHFHDVAKNPNMEFEIERYRKHLKSIFTNN